MMRILILADHDNSALMPSTLNTVTCGLLLGTVDIVIAGFSCGDVAKAAACIPNVETVICIDDVSLQHGLAENMTPQVMALVDDYDAVLAPATSFGKNVLPRIAALMDVQQISDVCEIIDANTFKHPIYAGNAFEIIECQSAKKVFTVRITAFEAALTSGGTGIVKNTPPVPTPDISTFVSAHHSPHDRPELTTAPVVIAGGRGMGSRQNFTLLEKIADLLSGTIGASRAAVDAEYISNDHQVGQTGKTVAPDLYIAVGISGAIQHLAGMRESRIIIAINSDPNAPIFHIVDYGLVGDLNKILPELAHILAKCLPKTQNNESI